MKNKEKCLADIKSWDAFFAYTNSLTEKDKGDLFEKLTHLMLTTKPEYCSILKNVWVHREGIPRKIRKNINLPHTDEGIDLVAETIRGEFWVIQCKFKGQNQSPTYKEISTFTYLANSFCKNISLALLVHTGEKGVRKKSLLGEKYSELGLEFWLDLNDQDWTRIHKKLNSQSTRPLPRIPRPHQNKAITLAENHYLKSKANRGRLIMPCGTGKSLTAFWIAGALKVKSVIVAVPSLSLIKQSLEDWTREFVALNEDPKPEWLVICSDDSTGALEEDEFVSDIYSLGIPTTTNIGTITAFLKEEYTGRKIIFTTYQSSDRLAAAAKRCHFKFDLAILDEAHKTVGEKSKSFAVLLSDNNVKISKRMFMTVTERIVKGKNDDVYSMDDEGIYGKQFYRLTFKEAIHSTPQIICDYEILTITVSNQEIQELINKNKLITDKSQKLQEQESQSIAAAIALRKATKKYGIKHAISFHRSIKLANAFTILNQRLNENKLDGIDLTSSHISSKKSAGQRAQIMKDFTDEQLALLTNARCLTEGVNVPAIDCVLFADPKQSVVDIVQAAGRALRPFPGKDSGFIMMPLTIPDGVVFDEFIKSTAFRQIGKIITALSTQDESIAEELRIIDAVKRPTGKKIRIEGSLPVGVKVDFATFVNSINAKIWESVAKVNWRSFQDARKYIHSLQLKSSTEWRRYSRSGRKPMDIPDSPDRTYKDEGWTSWGDWLGTGSVANRFKEFLPFSEAREYARSLNLKNITEWRFYSTSGRKPKYIPAKPSTTYQNEGWISFGDWLGTETIAHKLKEFLPFTEAKQFVHTLKLNSRQDWRQYCRSAKKPKEIPSAPDKAYENKGWVSYGDWLGTGSIAPQLKEYLPFEEARKFVHSLKLKDVAAWIRYSRSGSKPNYLPAKPYRTYQNKGWISFGDWLGTGVIAARFKKYLPFNEARKYVHNLKLKNSTEWRRYCRSGQKPTDISASPHKTYKNAGWINYGDWLGTGDIATRFREYLPFEEARQYVQTLQLKAEKEWRKYCRSKQNPKNIPANAHTIYKNKGWISWGDWLGTKNATKRVRVYLPFLQARQYVHTLKFSTKEEWKRYCRSGQKPKGIPSNPNDNYKNKGWISWGDWLGTGYFINRLAKYLPFTQARQYVHTLKLKGKSEWERYCGSGQRPKDIPSNPSQGYKNKGWITWGDWLGTGSIAPQLKEYLPLEEARNYVQSLKLKNVIDWNNYCRSGSKPKNIPASPAKTYKNKGWVTWNDWLGNQK